VSTLLFGLVLGAWVDRHDRKRLMVASDLGRAALVATIPVAAALHALTAWWIYAIAFASATLAIVFEACEFAAMPSLARGDELARLNGRVQATYSVAAVAGPLLAGALVSVVSLPIVVLADALTFVVSAWTVAAIRTRFDARTEPTSTAVLDDVRAGLRTVWNHPVLRNIAIMMALVNFLAVTANAQLVLLAKRAFGASDAEVAWLYAAESLGMAACALLVAPLRRRWSFAAVALGALMVNGVLIAGFAHAPSYPVALVLWALCGGAAIVFNVATSTLRQQIVSDDMLGRVMTVASVAAWSTVPLGALAGGFFVEHTGDVVLALDGIAAAMIAIPLAFAFSSAWSSLAPAVEP